MRAAFLIIFFLQAIAMLIDEFHFHRRRGLPLWERIGHPIDSFVVFLCFLLILWQPFGPKVLAAYIAGGILSGILVTKDEFVHARLCDPAEHWLHSVQFLLHPLFLAIPAFAWPSLHPAEGPVDDPLLHTLFVTQVSITGLFCVYQALYWNFLWNNSKPERNPSSTTRSTIRSVNAGTRGRTIRPPCSEPSPGSETRGY